MKEVERIDPATYAPPYEEAEGLGFNFRDYLIILLKRRWLIITVIVLAVVGTAIYSLRQTPLFTARSVLHFETKTVQFLQEYSPNPNLRDMEVFLNSQRKLLESKAIQTRMIKTLKVKYSQLAPWGVHLAPAKNRSDQLTDEQISKLADQFKSMCMVQQIQGTTLIGLTYETPNAELSALLANGLANEFKEYIVVSQFELTQQAEELLDEQVKSLQAEISDKQNTLQTYNLESDILKVKGFSSAAEERIRALTASLSEATRSRIELESKLREVQSRPKGLLPELTASNNYQNLRVELSRVQQTYSDRLKIYTADYPEMERLRAQMDSLNQKINQEVDDTFKRVLAAAQSAHSESVRSEGEIQRQLEAAKREAVEGNRKEIDYEKLAQEIDTKKRILAGLQEKRNQAGVSVQVQEKMPTIVRILEKGEKPNKQSSPNIPKNLAFSLLFGVLGGIVLAFTLEFFDKTLKTAEDLEKYIHVPVLGIIPEHIADNGIQPALTKSDTTTDLDSNLPDIFKKSRELSAMSDGHSVTSEALRSVRTSLLLSFPGEPPRSILVTSSRPGEGKTFISSNLAVVLAQLSKKVVVVDADLRNPRLHRVWGMENKMGLTNLLTTYEPIESALKPTPDPRVFLITSGSKSPRPAELLSSQRFDELMGELSKQFDHVILDSPPLLPVSDSVIIAAKCSAVMMVVRGGITPRDVVIQAKKKLLKSNPILAGAVLNCINLQDPYYYYSYYSYYREYYGNDRPRKELQS